MSEVSERVKLHHGDTEHTEEITKGEDMLETVKTQTDSIAVAGAPAIAGLAFRGFRGEVDYPAMAEVFVQARKADQIEWVESAEDIARQYRYLTNCDPYRDMLFAEVDGQVIGYGRMWWLQFDDGTRVYAHFAQVKPAWRELGIRQAMLRYNERRLREIAAAQRDEVEVQMQMFESWASTTERDWTALLQAGGYRPVRYGYSMMRADLENLPELPLPAGLEVRPVQPEQIETIWFAAQEAFRDHWGYNEDEWDLKHLREWQEMPIFTPELWQVAWDGDEVAGMVLNFINEKENAAYGRRRGYTETICVRRPWRRLGLARTLIARSFHVLKAQGMMEAALGVDSQNPNGARQLYEDMGFRTVKVFVTYRKPLAESPCAEVNNNGSEYTTTETYG